MELTPLQQKVFDLAKERLQHNDWFKCVCVQCFPDDEEIIKEGVEDCVQMVMTETEYWDNPAFFQDM